MTLFLKDYIPDQIQTIEQLSIWCAEILSNNYPNLTAVVQINPQTAEDILERRIEANKFYYTAPEVPTWRYLSRFQFNISSNHQRYGKIWEHAIAFGDLPIPSEMRKAV